ncbi:hypothetical protein PXD04_06875 [Methanosphaera sp. ISO3-F5]|nr:hypothetical protein [Methanosphaera sp. ISO3-F5]WQH63426.1 hypothetical protein PXD04_06875 [Methanosphaera sp. ISO3-F5]
MQQNGNQIKNREKDIIKQQQLPTLHTTIPKTNPRNKKTTTNNK